MTHLAKQCVIDRHQATLTNGSAGFSIKVHLWILQIRETANKENGEQEYLRQKQLQTVIRM